MTRRSRIDRIRNARARERAWLRARHAVNGGNPDQYKHAHQQTEAHWRAVWADEPRGDR